MKKALILIMTLVVVSTMVFGSCTEPEATTSEATTSEATTSEATTSEATTSEATTTASTPTTEPTTGPKYGGILTMSPYSLAGGVIGYPPEMGADSSHWSSHLCLESLLHENPSGVMEPWLAESYVLADDHMSVTLNLREGVQFHDGSDFNAEVAKWNIDNAIEAKKSRDITSVDIIDDYTIQVYFKGWKNSVITDLHKDYLWMASKAAFDEYGIDYSRTHPVGTGPFVFESYEQDASFTVVRNDNYWQEGLPYLDGVELIYTTDSFALKAAMETGLIDSACLVPGKTTYDLEEMGMVVDLAMDCSHCLWPDSVNADSPWSDQKVREAVAYAIDRESIAEAFGYGYWEAAYQLPVPNRPAYDPDFPLAREYDPEKAMQLLAEADWEGEIETTLIAKVGDFDEGVLLAIQENLADVGITLNLETPLAPAFSEINDTGWNNAALLGTLYVSPNFNSYLNYAFGDGYGRNASVWRPPEYLEALSASLSAETLDADLLRAATDIVSEYAAIIPIYYMGKAFVYRPHVMNLGAFETTTQPVWLPATTWLDI